MVLTPKLMNITSEEPLGDVGPTKESSDALFNATARGLQAMYRLRRYAIPGAKYHTLHGISRRGDLRLLKRVAFRPP